jgi:aminopeptidase N
VASNGLLISAQPTDDTEQFIRYHWKHTHPIATYLIAIAVTNYVELRSEVEVPDGQPISIVDYAYREELEPWQLNQTHTRKAMQFFNERFMLYPFANEKYGHARFPWGGGMEHQTMSFMFNLDEPLVVHELAHQWFGDHITCGSWNDIWLNEGFATYCEDLYIERYYPNTFVGQRMLRRNSITGLPGGSVYCYNTSDVNVIFDSRLSYDKGAMVLHMLRKQVGDDAFFNGIRSYLRDPALAGGFAETADLQRHIEAAADTSLVEFFDSWIYQQGYPSYRVAWQVGDTKTWVKISQTQSHASAGFFKMHVPVQFKTAGKDTILWLHHTEEEQIFGVDPGFRPTDVSFDPNVEMISKNNRVVREDFVSLQAVPVPVRDDVRQILIYRPDGQQVGQAQVPGTETHIPLSSGVYVVKTVYRDQSVTTQKILIQQPQP